MTIHLAFQCYRNLFLVQIDAAFPGFKDKDEKDACLYSLKDIVALYNTFKHIEAVFVKHVFKSVPVWSSAAECV